MQATRFKSVALARLGHEMVQLVLDRGGQDQAGEPGGRIARSDQFAQLAARCGQQRGLQRRGGAGSLAGVSPGPELLGQTGMTLLLLRRGELHSKVEEAGLVPLCMTLDEPYELLC